MKEYKLSADLGVDWLIDNSTLFLWNIFFTIFNLPS